MSAYKGRTVHISLNNGIRLVGVISGVDNGTLHVQNAQLSDGRTVPSMSVQGQEIAEIKMVNPLEQQFQQQQPAPPQQQQPQQSQAKPNSAALLDPAIVSAGATKPVQQQQQYEDSSDESSVDEDPYTAEEFRGQRQQLQQQNQQPPPPPPQQQQQPQAQSKPKKKRNNKKNNNNNNNNNNSASTKQPGFDNSNANGWAQEDLSEVKDTEFDFQANLDLFDKERVFDEISKTDTMIGKRLVDHNKVDPHQAKFGNREMVLNDKRSQQQIDSANATPPPPPPPPTDRQESPNLEQLRKHSTTGGTRHSQLFTYNTGKPCPCASPLQLLEVQRLMTKCGISDSVATENAARGIAQVVIRALGGPTRLSESNHNSRPLVVALVGNNQAGRRALSAARHLVNRDVNVVALTIGEGDACEQELKAFGACKGRVETRFESLITALKEIDDPVELIIDGLQGYEVTAEDLWEEDATTVLGLIDWANRSKAKVISLEIPSGLDPSTGLTNSLLTQSYIHPNWVLSCGLPLTGVLNAYLAGIVDSSDTWTHYLLDIGTPRNALNSGAMKKFNKIWFGSDWLIELVVN